VAPTEVLPRAVAEAREALEIDEADTDAHMALGLVSYWFEWQWDRALQHLTRAVRISPGNATAQTFLGSLLDTLGRHDEAMKRRRVGYELDPLDATSVLNFGYGHLIGRNFDEAIAIFERALELDPRSAAATYGLGMAQVDSGRFVEGRRTFEAGIRDVEAGSTMKGFLGWSLALAGRTEDAEAVLEDILADVDSRPVSPYHVGLVYLGLGRLDEYFEWLEAAFQQRSIWMAWFTCRPTPTPSAPIPDSKPWSTGCAFPRPRRPASMRTSSS
jgi:Flp pilus assembly protein TadD